MDTRLLDALAAGGAVLTANRRLVRTLRGEHDRLQMAAGRTAWPTPAIHALQDWVRRTWDEVLERAAVHVPPDGTLASGAQGSGAAAAPMVLGERQARLVWEHVIEEHAQAAHAASHGVAQPFGIAGLAKLAHQTWKQLAEWSLSVPEPAPHAPLEQRAFAAWCRHYAERCQAHGWTDQAAVPRLLADSVTASVRAGALHLPTRLLLVGFDEIAPQIQSLLETLDTAGCPHERYGLPESAGQARRVAFADGAGELEHAVRWARLQLERNQEANPEVSIGLVVPDLSAQRAAVERALTQVFTPAAVLPSRAERERPFNISQGLPLADYPIVRTALAALALTPRPLTWGEWSGLLRSPFLGGAESERAGRALLLHRLGRMGAARISAASVGNHAGAVAPSLASGAGGVSADGTPPEGPPLHDAPPLHHAPLLAALLRRWRAAWDAQPPRQAPSGWAAAFSKQLQALGWPGERPLDSAEFQTLESWRSLLAELARCDVVAPAMSRGEALACLRSLAVDAVFQPQGSAAAVQVLGVLEASGQRFDHLWVLGLHEEVWPPAPRPTPFLPLEFQRRHGLPRSSVARELEISRRETERLLAAAPAVLVSYPLRQGELELRPSPLIAHLPLLAATEIGADSTPTWADTLAATAAAERYTDTQAPPLTPGALVSGGTGVFRDQAACPFRAFAVHRLRAREVPEPVDSLGADLRGQAAHLALQRLWKALGSHRALIATSDTDREALIAAAVEEGLAEAVMGVPEPPGSRLLAQEAERLRVLLALELAVEAERAPFTVMDAERQVTITVGGVEVTGRLDRVDRLEAGGEVVLDYKTGRTAPSTSGWLGERPDDPQLPLYGLAPELAPAGLAFVHLLPSGVNFVGASEADPGFSKLQSMDSVGTTKANKVSFASMQAFQVDRRRVLEALADQFRRGEAAVQPKKPPLTCSYCPLPLLCRFGVTEPEQDVSEDQGGAPTLDQQGRRHD